MLQGAGAGYLIALCVVSVVAGTGRANAETPKRVITDAAPVAAKVQVAPKYRRAAFTRDSLSGERPSWSHDRYAPMVAEASAQHAVPERLIWAVMSVESNFDHLAVSRRGAVGLMQLMPETAAVLGVRDAFDPYENINAGTRHLRAMLDRFSRDVRLAVAAYNAGERAVLSFRGVPPYRETRNYVSRVMQLYRGGRNTDRVTANAAPHTGVSVAVRPAPTPVAVRPAPTPVRRTASRSADDNPQEYGSDVQRFIGVDGTVTYTSVPGTHVASAR